MLDIKTYVERIADNANSRNKLEAGNYIADELIYCGKCNTPRQCVVEWFGQSRAMPCACACEIAAMERDRKARRLQANIDRANKLADELGFSLDGMRNKTFAGADGSNPGLMAAARKYADGFEAYYHTGKGLFIYGEVGVGKSFAATCIANALIARGYTAVMANFATIDMKATATYNGKSAYISMLEKADLLIIDDLFAEKNTESMRETVHCVIDARLRSGRPTIYTSNITQAAIKSTSEQDIYRERILSRIIGSCHMIHVTGEDKRISQAKAEYAATKREFGI